MPVSIVYPTNRCRTYRAKHSKISLQHCWAIRLILHLGVRNLFDKFPFGLCTLHELKSNFSFNNLKTCMYTAAIKPEEIAASWKQVTSPMFSDIRRKPRKIKIKTSCSMTEMTATISASSAVPQTRTIIGRSRLSLLPVPFPTLFRD